MYFVVVVVVFTLAKKFIATFQYQRPPETFATTAGRTDAAVDDDGAAFADED